MDESRGTSNELSGQVNGDVVQARDIHGDVVFSAAERQVSPEQAELEARWRTHLTTQLDAEDAERRSAQLAFEKNLVRTRRRWYYSLVLLVLGPLLILLQTTQHMDVLWGLGGLCCALIGLRGCVINGYRLYRARR